MAIRKKVSLFQTALGLSAACLLAALLFGLLIPAPTPAKIFAAACPVLLAVGLSDTPLKGFRYTVLIIAAVTAPCVFRSISSASGPSICRTAV